MASTVPSIHLEVRFFIDGKIRPLVSHPVKIVRDNGFPTPATVIATVATDANGIFPATVVSDPVGTALGLSVESYYEMGGCWMTVTI